MKQLFLFQKTPKHYYVGLPVTEFNWTPVGLWFSAVSLFLGLKLKISQE